MSTDLLVKFLNQHDVASPSATVVRTTDAGILVRTWECGPDAVWRLVEETIPATLQAARDWLGY
jgi:hypothetical protein